VRFSRRPRVGAYGARPARLRRGPTGRHELVDTTAPGRTSSGCCGACFFRAWRHGGRNGGASRSATGMRFAPRVAGDGAPMAPTPAGTCSRCWWRAAVGRPCRVARVAGYRKREHYPCAIPDQPAMAAGPFESVGALETARRICRSEVSLRPSVFEGRRNRACDRRMQCWRG